jgi:endo-1,4-beta-xylanase
MNRSPIQSMTRRKFVAQASAIGALTIMPAGAVAQEEAAAQKDDALTIRAAGEARGILAGCAVAVARLRDDPGYTALVSSQAGIVVAENEFKFGHIHPAIDMYSFDDADYLATFAKTNSMKLRGHNFVWHRSLPPWFATDVTTQNAEKILVEHIEKVAGHFTGRIHSWDVVNEAINPKDGLAGGLRNSPWQHVLPGYIDIAFRTARHVDPKALLVYNDYGIEAEDEGSAKKRADVLGLLRGMKDRGVPIDALGIQSHISADPAITYGAGLKHLISEAAAMDLKILLTEMDVNDRKLPPDIPTRDESVAKCYAEYLKIALKNPSVIALLTWGITDRYTWLNGELSRADKLPERPLPFDRNLKPKSAFSAEIQALSSARSRS